MIFYSIIYVTRPRNFILDNFTVNSIGAHLCPWYILAKFSCVKLFLFWF
jgi:hypothetical protein